MPAISRDQGHATRMPEVKATPGPGPAPAADASTVAWFWRGGRAVQYEARKDDRLGSEFFQDSLGGAFHDATGRLDSQVGHLAVFHDHRQALAAGTHAKPAGIHLHAY